jgi:hypothetical protein
MLPPKAHINKDRQELYCCASTQCVRNLENLSVTPLAHVQFHDFNKYQRLNFQQLRIDEAE